MRVKTSLLTLALTAAPASASLRLLIPAYFDPSQSSGWNTLISSASSSVPITAIMNPNSGPVGTVDASYTAAISGLEAAGGQVVAYVHTSYGARSISAVETDIATYKSEYPSLDGIFLDEMAVTSGKLNYYKSIYNYIKTQNSAWQVIGNPGTNTQSTYLAPTPAAADQLVTFESNAAYTTYAPSSWQSGYSSASFANIAYAVPAAATMQSDLLLAGSNQTGSMYVTDLAGTNPYSALPTYWTQEVAAVSAINQPLKATFVHTGSGDFNTQSNWSAAIPNGIGAEADFLGAITANHTVYSDIPITLGTIIFNNSHSYVLAGAGSITLQTLSGSALVQAQAGVQTISLPINLQSSATLSASAGATLVISAPVTVGIGESLTESGAGSIRLLGSVTLQSGASANFRSGSAIQSLNVGAASHASIVASDQGEVSALTTQSLSVADSAVVDLNGQDLIIASGDLESVEQSVRAGLLSGKAIIDSTELKSPGHLTCVGVVSNAVDGSALYASFGGAPADSTDILLKSTLFGDTNLDGLLDTSDYARINAGAASGLSGWFNGDFNYDGIINGSDYTLIDNAFNTQQASLAASTPSPAAAITDQLAGTSAVPEPTMAGVLSSAWAANLILRRRKRISL